MELGVNLEQNLSSLTTTVVNIFDKYNKKFWYPQDLFQIMTLLKSVQLQPSISWGV